jgi:crotonobetainyl-CoA:carnitine CoA-transferase CaiB-like acyl-CoA transferase
MLLGDMGADVVKVEPPGRGENSRGFAPFIEGESLYTMVFNRNKRSLTLDLHSEQGKEVLRSLLKKADVLVENFVPGTLEKMGLEWSTLKELNPRLIVTRISGFGQSGPLTRMDGQRWPAPTSWIIPPASTPPSGLLVPCRVEGAPV